MSTLWFDQFSVNFWSKYSIYFTIFNHFWSLLIIFDKFWVHFIIFQSVFDHFSGNCDHYLSYLIIFQSIFDLFLVRFDHFQLIFDHFYHCDQNIYLLFSQYLEVYEHTAASDASFLYLSAARDFGRARQIFETVVASQGLLFCKIYSFKIYRFFGEEPCSSG